MGYTNLIMNGTAFGPIDKTGDLPCRLQEKPFTM